MLSSRQKARSRAWLFGVCCLLICLSGLAGAYSYFDKSVSASPSAKPLSPGFAYKQHAPLLTNTPCAPTWTLVSSPNPYTLAELQGVSATSSNDVWAVGAYNTSTASSGYQTLILHWDGIQWTIVPSPNPGNYNNRLLGVTTISPTDAWAVGIYESTDVIGHVPLLLHWNGSAWTQVAGPTITTSSVLFAVAARASNDVWAVGLSNSQAMSMHWNGSTWSLSPLPPISGVDSSYLLGVTTIASNDVWAVGYTSTAGYWQTLIVHWNGSSWSLVSSPNPSSVAQLEGVDAVSANDVWAVGTYAVSGHYSTLTMHWNGSVWSVVPSPNVGTLNNDLKSVTAISSNDVWAAGFYPIPPDEGATLAEHWNGSSWSVVPSPNAPTHAIPFESIWAISANDIWAVGGRSGEGDRWSQTLTQHYTDPCAPPPPTYTSTVTRIPTRTFTVTRTPTRTPTFTVTPTPCGPSTNYTYTTATATIVPGITDTGNHCGDCTSNISLPFPETFYGNTFSTANVSSNGTLQFGSNLPAPNNNCLPHSSFSHLIAPFWDDLNTNNQPNCSVFPGGCGIYTSVSGSSPNRIFNIEWRAVYDSAPNMSVNFEIRLYEAGPRIDFVYGTLNGNGSSATVGIQRGSGAQWSQFECNNGILSNGLMILFAQPVCPVLLVGHVTVQGRPTPPSALQSVPVTLTLKSATSETNYPVQTTDASGFFTVSVSGLPNGTYNWRVKGPKYLANTGTTGLTGAPTTQQEMGLMRAGDANNDNVVSALDFNIVRGAFGKSCGQPGYDDRADFTGDCLVSSTDFNLIRSNFGTSGSPPIGPWRYDK